MHIDMEGCVPQACDATRVFEMSRMTCTRLFEEESKNGSCAVVPGLVKLTVGHKHSGAGQTRYPSLRQAPVFVDSGRKKEE